MGSFVEVIFCIREKEKEKEKVRHLFVLYESEARIRGHILCPRLAHYFGLPWYFQSNGSHRVETEVKYASPPSRREDGMPPFAPLLVKVDYNVVYDFVAIKFRKICGFISVNSRVNEKGKLLKSTYCPLW